MIVEDAWFDALFQYLVPDERLLSEDGGLLVKSCNTGNEIDFVAKKYLVS